MFIRVAALVIGVGLVVLGYRLRAGVKRANICSSCRYELRGLEVCPECGRRATGERARDAVRPLLAPRLALMLAGVLVLLIGLLRGSVAQDVADLQRQAASWRVWMGSSSLVGLLETVAYSQDAFEVEAAMNHLRVRGYDSERGWLAAWQIWGGEEAGFAFIEGVQVDGREVNWPAVIKVVDDLAAGPVEDQLFARFRSRMATVCVVRSVQQSIDTTLLCSWRGRWMESVEVRLPIGGEGGEVVVLRGFAPSSQPPSFVGEPTMRLMVVGALPARVVLKADPSAEPIECEMSQPLVLQPIHVDEDGNGSYSEHHVTHAVMIRGLRVEVGSEGRGDDDSGQ